MAKPKEENQFKYAENEIRDSLIAQGYVITDDDMKTLFWEVFEYATFAPPTISNHWDDWDVEHKTNTERFEFYLKNGANPNIKISYRRLPKVITPILSIAAWYDLVEVVGLLLQYGADKEATSEIGWTAWMYAQQLGNKKIVQLLEKNGAKKHDLSPQAFIKAAERQDIETVKEWLVKGVDVDLLDEKGETALYKSVTITDDYTCADVLIKAGATINIHYKAASYKTLLERVVANRWNDKKNKKQFVQQLLPLTNAKQHIGGFFQAVFFEHFDIAEMIFSTTNAIFIPTLLEFHRLLRKACFTGDLKLLNYLIKKGADLNQNTGHYYRETPLTLAISKRHVNIVKRLLEAGADPNFRNGVGSTPLEVCALRGRELKTKMGVLLVKNGADLLAKNKENHTILTRYDSEIDFVKAVKVALDKIK